MPIYPLSEDVQPGDVYLVQATMEAQAATYDDQGYLPFELLVTRVDSLDYRSMYGGDFGTAASDGVPKHWRAIEADSTRWREAPGAAFPAYTVKVSTSAGLDLGVPIHGVPIALNAMRRSAANATVQITEAHTYGEQMWNLFRRVTAWSEQDSVRKFLRQYGAKDDSSCLAGGDCRFLRVVSRVYLAGGVNVAVSANAASGVIAGNHANEESTSGVDSDAVDAAARLNARFAEALKAAPGGRLEFTSASDRSVALREQFPRPLVVGYLGFDMAILADGSLGPPVPTLLRLRRQASALDYFAGHAAPDSNTALLRSWLARDPANRDSLRVWLRRDGYGPLPIPLVLRADGQYRAIRAAYACRLGLR